VEARTIRGGDFNLAPSPLRGGLVRGGIVCGCIYETMYLALIASRLEAYSAEVASATKAGKPLPPENIRISRRLTQKHCESTFLKVIRVRP
jgi:hypothetical protein